MELPEDGQDGDEEDYEARSLRDAIRRMHDEDLSALAKLAIIRSDMGTFKKMMDDMSVPSLSPRSMMNLRKFMEEPVTGAGRSAAGKEEKQETRARRPQRDEFRRQQSDPAEADAFYRRIRSESEPKNIGISPEQLSELAAGREVQEAAEGNPSGGKEAKA